MATEWENSLRPERQIDMMALQPSFVSTKMIEKFEKKGEAFGSVSVEACVGAALRDLGTEQRTYGPYQHEAIAAVLGTIMRYAPLGKRAN